MTGVKEEKSMKISDVTKGILRTREDKRRENDEWIYRFAKIEYLIIKRFIEVGHHELDRPCRSCPAYNFCLTLAGIGPEPSTNSSAEAMLNCHSRIFESGILDDIMRGEKEEDAEEWVNVVNEFRKTYKILEERTEDFEEEEDS